MVALLKTRSQYQNHKESFLERSASRHSFLTFLIELIVVPILTLTAVAISVIMIMLPFGLLLGWL